MLQSEPIALYTKTWLASGTGLFAQALAGGILDAGSPVLYIAPLAEDLRFEQPRSGLSRLKTIRPRNSGGKLQRIMASIARVAGTAVALTRARMRTRIFLVSIPDPLIFALPMLAALRLTGAKVHYVVHDPLPHVWKLPRRLRFFENIGYRATYALSSSLIVLSETGKSVLKHNYRLASKPIAVIEHGVFALDTAPCAPGEQRLLLFGTLRRNKSIREAMEAVVAARARGSRATLTVAGSIDGTEPDYWPMCEPIALAHPDAITLEIGYVEQSRLSVLVNECDAFLLPYRDFHSQSGVAMLAASNARTLIASRAGGIGELIADGMAAVAIELPVGTAEITDAILAFEAEPITKWNARALAYREKTMSSRAWEVIGANYIKVSRGGAA